MLDLSLEDVRFQRAGTAFRLDLDIRFKAGTRTALIGPAGSGKSAIIRLLYGSLRPDRGIIRFGTRDATPIKAGRRPLLHLPGDSPFPERWSVQHVLLAALRSGELDREDRLAELKRLAAEWDLIPLLSRPVRGLASSEKIRVSLARTEALRPAVLVGERPLAGASPSEKVALIDRFYRMLRVFGTTAVLEIDTLDEMGWCDEAVVIDGGNVIQSGHPGEVFSAPNSRVSAEATGAVNLIPVEVSGGRAESLIGEWDATGAGFSGPGTAVLRPGIFSLAEMGEESDLILGIEEAHFRDGGWEILGLLTGGTLLRVWLPGTTRVHKGRLLPLKYDATRISLLPGGEPLKERIPTDVIGPMR